VSHEQNVVSSVSPTWLQLVQDSYMNDPFAQELIAKLALSALAVLNYTLKDGLLRYKNIVWVGNEPVLQK
jgi:hypothetical protein